MGADLAEDAPQTMGERLRLVRADRPAHAFAESLGISRNTLMRYESDERQPDATLLKTLNEQEGVDLTWLVTGAGKTHAAARLARHVYGEGHVSSEDIAFSMRPPLAKEIQEREQRWGVSLTIEEAVELVRAGVYVWVPFYDLPLSGGGGAEVLDQPPKQWNFYTRQYIAGERGLNGADLAEFPVRGNSMVPELHDRNTVMVDRSRTELIGVDLYALRIGTQFFVKYLERQPDGSVLVTSKNEDEYRPFTVPAADFESGHAKVIGRVMRKGQDR